MGRAIPKAIRRLVPRRSLHQRKRPASRNQPLAPGFSARLCQTDGVVFAGVADSRSQKPCSTLSSLPTPPAPALGRFENGPKNKLEFRPFHVSFWAGDFPAAPNRLFPCGDDGAEALCLEGLSPPRIPPG